ncbi:MAG: DUF1566 domain-containing protein [Mariniphaga sp.]
MRKLLFILFFICSGNLLFSQVKDTTKGKHFIGEHYGGGIVFFIDDSSTHGLIASPEDQTNSIEWGCMGYHVGASFMTDGKKNTALIVQKCGKRTAAGLCANLTEGGFADWYLPSQSELNSMYQKADKIGNLSGGVYCSSTEYSQRENKNNCWCQNFGKEGKQFFWDKKRKYFVRAIRQF